MSAEMRVSLTKPQLAALTRERFTKGPGGSITSADERGFSVKVGKSTFYRLLDLRLIEHKALDRYGLTEQGRALLAQDSQESANGR